MISQGDVMADISDLKSDALNGREGSNPFPDILMIVSSYRHDGGILNIVSKGKRYTYFNVNVYFYNKIKIYIKKSLFGRAWVLLKELSK